MANFKTDGNCYICGKTLGKMAMKNHILKEHTSNGDEECLLLKIEGTFVKQYWLFIDISKNKRLEELDKFLRDIWLECCGHMSVFSINNEDIAKSVLVNAFSAGDKLIHEYDMGSTTMCTITVLGEIHRPKQRKPVRLLARNVPHVFMCASCGKPAEIICQECLYDCKDPYYCLECAQEHEHDNFVPITNSPRCGTCGYGGEFDIYAFDPDKL